MIKYIDERCYGWAKELRDRPAQYSSVIKRMMDGTGSVQMGGSMPVSPDALEIERIVCERISDMSGRIVCRHYILGGSSVAKIKSMRVDRRRYYDLLDTAHHEIDCALNGEVYGGDVHDLIEDDLDREIAKALAALSA